MSKKIIFMISLLFSTSSIFAEGIGGSGSSANTPTGAKAKPSQSKVIIHTGCGSGRQSEVKSINTGIDKPMPGTLGEGSPPIVYTQHIGTWQREALYINGILNHRTPATLIYEQNSFRAFGTCSTSGTILVTEDRIKTIMTQSNCPGGVKAPMTFVYTYKITKDGKKLILEVGPVRELYTRK